MSVGEARHAGLGVSGALLFVALLLEGCGGDAGTAAGPAAPARLEPRGPAAFATDDAAFGRYHSKRFLLSFPLPDGKQWKIDDRSGSALVATHAPTSSTFTVEVTREAELMSRSTCEARARRSGWVPTGSASTMPTVEEHVQTGPEAYDSKVWVALEPGKAGGAVAGHVFLFGGFLRQCLLVHYRTEVASSRDEDALAARLALVRTRVLRGLEIDPPRVTDDAEVPRTKPNVTR